MRKTFHLAAIGGVVQFLLMALLCAQAPSAHAAEYATGAAPAWVVPVKVPDAPQPAANMARGETALLSDVQTRIDAGGKTAYYHYASKALDSRGVAQVADISFSFDPSYEKLAIHAIKVVRDGRVIDKLKSASIRVMQRETELEYRIYDGSKTVSIVLDDLRVGDIVEYAYSRSGANPVFKNQLAGGAPMQWSVPVARVFVRLLAPAKRAFAVSTRNTAAKPEVTEAGGYRDYRWERDNVPAIKIDDGAPASYSPYATAHWTEFADWKAVVDWGVPLYKVPAQVDRSLAEAIGRISEAAATAEERLLAVLQLVQRDIRYLGIEVGQGSYAPNSPALVFQRRFGDCKDKALLTVTMLRALGLSADPALVNTVWRAAIGELPPSPNVFDHALVRVRIDGRSYWVDPTRQPQSGDLAHLSQADYGMALVLASGEGALTSMAPAVPVRERKLVHSVFDATAGSQHPVRYTIRTTLHGEAAEDLRSSIAARGQAELQDGYLNFYARRYPGIKVAAALVVADEPAKNRMITTETYAIADFWQRPEDGSRRRAYIRSAELRSRLNRPDAVHRSAPLKVKFPEEIEEITEVKLAGDWKVESSNTEIHDPAFEFQHKTEAGGDRATYVLTDRYRTLAGEVKSEAAHAYAANLEKAYDSVGLTLRLKNDGAVIAPSIFSKYYWQFGTGLLLAVWGILAWFCRRSPQEHRKINGSLLNCFVLICALLLIIARTFPNGWKSQSLCLIVAFGGSLIVMAMSASAPETHWLHAIDNSDALARRPAGAKAMIRGFAMVPMLLGWIGVLYFLVQVFS